MFDGIKDAIPRGDQILFDENATQVNILKESG